jgi:hypothetical protein
MLFRPVAFHDAHDAPAATAETFVAIADRVGTVSPHGVRARSRVSVLGHGLSYLVAIGPGLSPRRACGQQCKSSSNEDSSHVDCFLSQWGSSPYRAV